MRHLCLMLLLFLVAAVNGQITPEIFSWKLNNGEIGSYYVSGNTTPVSNGIDANVQQVRYSTDNVYVNSTGIPDYPTGPFLDGNPARAGEQDYLFRIPRTPQEKTGTKTATGLGHIGVLRNGVPIYNALDAMSYNNQGIWNRNAVVMENDGFDCTKGHPAPNMQGGLTKGFYHHHQNPASFTHSANPPSTVCNQYPSDGLYIPDSTQHSPINGFAFDGFPIYGAYGYADGNDAQSGIKRMQTSYQKRNITDRTTLPDGTVLNTNQYGPAINTNFPIGSFIEDYEYAGNGDLDEQNGRFCITPEYPAGTYAYFATMDGDGNSEYPYLIGPNYYGIVATDNFPAGPGGGTNVTVTGSVTTWDGTTAVHNVQSSSYDFAVYPNPAKEYISIRFAEQFSDRHYFIYNTIGKMIASGKVQESNIEVSELTPGIYFLSVEEKRFKFVKK